MRQRGPITEDSLSPVVLITGAQEIHAPISTSHWSYWWAAPTNTELLLSGPEHEKGHSVDALVPGGDEGRGTLRKATGRGEQALIRGYPNGATHP